MAASRASSRITLALVLAGLGLSLVACTTHTYNRFLEADSGPGDLLSTRIGQQGGSLSVTDPTSSVFGTEVDVPAGAVGTDTTLSIQPSSAGDAVPYGSRPVGPAVDIDFVDLAVAATIRLPYRLDATANERLAVLRLNRAAGTKPAAADPGGTAGDTWDMLPTGPVGDDSRRVQLDTTRFGTFVVVVIPVGGTPLSQDGGVVTDGGPAHDMPAPTPGDVTPPTFAGLTSLTLVAGPRIKLDWQPASDEVTPASRLRYRVYLPSFATIGVSQGESPPGATSLELAGAPGVTYYILVRAVDEAGNEDSNLNVRSITVPRQFADGGANLPSTPDLPVSDGGADVAIGTDVGTPDLGPPPAACPGCSVIAPAQGTSSSLAIDVNRIYWTLPGRAGHSDGTLWAAPIGGGAATMLAQNQARPISLAVDPDSIFVLAADSGDVLAFPTGGGSPVTLATGLSQPGPLTANVGGVLVPLTGAGTVNQIDFNGNVPVASGLSLPVAAASDKSGLFVASLGLGGEIDRIFAGGTGLAVVVSQIGRPIAMAMDGSRIYWIDASTSAIFSSFKFTKGPATPVRLAGSQAEPNALATDGTFVYWTNVGDGTVRAVSAETGTPVVLARGQSRPGGIAVDGSFIYWTRADNGGEVIRLAKGTACTTTTDCLNPAFVCVSGQCQPPSCFDQQQDGDETDSDCGGAFCGPCSDGAKCLVSSDCSSKICGADKLCQPGSCSDGLTNQDESDVDCGGSLCAACADGKQCRFDGDCQNLACINGTCTAPSCSDQRRNPLEPDIDCGGPCPNKCLDGQSCFVASDCLPTSFCSGNVCTGG